MPLSHRHYFPDWARPIAQASVEGRWGVSLTRSGEILVFDGGNLRFSYRFGSWQYWNHKHIEKLIQNVARVQKTPPAEVTKVVGGIYRAALDVAFRRTGALFVILKNSNHLRHIVRDGDAIMDERRPKLDRQLDEALTAQKLADLPPAVAAEIAALDGAVVMNNRGTILAYGAVLSPRRGGKLKGTEGSRTRAALGASNYGVAVKVSSDGDMKVYWRGALIVGT